MAANTTINLGTGGDVIRDIDKGGVKTQVMALDIGGAGAENLVTGFMPTKITNGTTTADVSASNELLVSFKDMIPAVQSITAQDVASTVTTGSNNQSIITGTPTAGSFATLTISGDTSFSVSVLGTWTGTLQFERSLDAGVTYTPIGAFAAGTSFAPQTTTANGNFHGNASSATTIRVRSTTAFTGTASIKLLAGAGVGTITVGNGIRLFDKVSGVEHTIKAASTLPVATDTAMVVAVRDAVAVTGTFYQATQPVSASALPLPSGASTETTLSALNTKVTAVNTGAVTISSALPTGANTIGSVKITDGTNTETIKAASTAPLLTDTAMVVTQRDPIPFGNNVIGKVSIADTQADIHGQIIQVTRISQINTKFFEGTPQSFLTITAAGGGTATQGTGTAVFSTSTATTASVLGQTPVTINYAAQYEAWAIPSAAFTTPTSSASYQRIGIYNTVDGFSFGYNGLTFGLWTRFNSVDTFIAQTNWNKDTLSAVAGSTFTSNGSPVSLVPTNFNMYRMRYGWYGSTDTYFEVYAPDGNWVVVHIVRTANAQTAVNLTNPNLPMTVDVSKTASDATDLKITCGGWAAGVTAPSSGPNLSGQKNIAALNDALLLPLTGLAAVSINIQGTWVGTISFQYSLDGITWYADTPINNITGVFASSTTVNNVYTATVASYKYYRAIATAWTSGTANIIYNGSAMSNFVVAQSLITDGNNNGPASVKPASTAAVAADPSLVVALHPTSPLPAGSNAIGTVAINAAIPAGTNAIGTVTAVGTAAPNAAASGNPVAVAGQVINTGTFFTTNGVIERLVMTTGGQLLIKPYGLPETDWQYAGATGGIINTTDVVVKAAGAAGIRNYLTGIDFKNTSGTVATEVVIKDGATVIWRGHVPINAPTVAITFPTPLRGTAATALNVACITTGAAVYFNAQGYAAA